MDVLERIRRGYRAIGHGASRDVLAMFHQEQLDPPLWVIDESGYLHPTRDVVALDLFAGGMPSQWEIIGVDLRQWEFYQKKSRLVVGGRFRARLRGTWEVIPLPFIHVWSFTDDQVKGVFDYFGGVEVRRLEDVRKSGWRGGLRTWLTLRAWRQTGAFGES
jgi:hypothetical protein